MGNNLCCTERCEEKTTKNKGEKSAPSQGAVYKHGRLHLKPLCDTEGNRPPWGCRGWTTYYAVVRGMALYLQRGGGGVNGPPIEEIASEKSLPLHHSMAKIPPPEEAARMTRRKNVFILRTSHHVGFLLQPDDADELKQWVDVLNFVAAAFSTPIPVPQVAAFSGDNPLDYCRVALPVTPTHLTIPEQLASQQKCLVDVEGQLASLQGTLRENAPPNTRGAFWTDFDREYSRRELFLKRECQRYAAYVSILKDRLENEQAGQVAVANVVHASVEKHREREERAQQRPQSLTAVLAHQAKTRAICRPPSPRTGGLFHTDFEEEQGGGGGEEVMGVPPLQQLFQHQQLLLRDVNTVLRGVPRPTTLRDDDAGGAAFDVRKWAEGERERLLHEPSSSSATTQLDTLITRLSPAPVAAAFSEGGEKKKSPSPDLSSSHGFTSPPPLLSPPTGNDDGSSIVLEVGGEKEVEEAEEEEAAEKQQKQMEEPTEIGALRAESPALPLPPPPPPPMGLLGAAAPAVEAASLEEELREALERRETRRRVAATYQRGTHPPKHPKDQEGKFRRQ